MGINDEYHTMLLAHGVEKFYNGEIDIIRFYRFFLIRRKIKNSFFKISNYRFQG
jgi:hypothetical protein